MSEQVAFPDLLETDSSQYDLYAVVNHLGLINMGHYTCYVKNEEKQSWFYYDDSSVQEVPEKKIRS
jgi:ubiquitin C-terminal hydrolase